MTHLRPAELRGCIRLGRSGEASQRRWPYKDTDKKSAGIFLSKPHVCKLLQSNASVLHLCVSTSNTSSAAQGKFDKDKEERGEREEREEVRQATAGQGVSEV